MRVSIAKSTREARRGGGGVCWGTLAGGVGCGPRVDGLHLDVFIVAGGGNGDKRGSEAEFGKHFDGLVRLWARTCKGHKCTVRCTGQMPGDVCLRQCVAGLVSGLLLR